MFTDIFNTDKKYSIIYADPPWSYSDSGCIGAAAAQYQTMSTKDIEKFPIEDIAEKDCVLFMWATYPKIEDALQLIKAWGFTYKSIAFQWIKQNRSGHGWFFGLGRWTRGNTEPCLIAVRGKPRRVSASVSQIIEYPLGAHSAKPPIVREKIMELMGGGTAIELFARQSVNGWDCWGNEAPTENEPSQPTATPKCKTGENTDQITFDLIKSTQLVRESGAMQNG